MRSGRKILIVDDDAALRQALAEQLELNDEFTAVECDTAAQALEIAEKDRFDAILLDIGLPDMDGRELCGVLRRNGVHVPIVMLTASDTDADTVLGLDSGADDYVTKPFRLSVLLARLRAHLRQSEHSDDAVFTIGPYFSSERKAADRSRRPQEGEADRKGNRHPQISVSCRRQSDRTRHPAWRGLGIQRRSDDAHARNACLPPSPKDRARSGCRPNSGNRAGRLSARSLTRATADDETPATARWQPVIG